jgi:hypothetical protein
MYTIPKAFIDDILSMTDVDRKRIAFVNLQVNMCHNCTATAQQVNHFEALALMIYPNKPNNILSND